MGVDPDDVRLKLFTDKPLYGATGFAAAQWQDAEDTWQRPTIRIERTTLFGRPADLIGTMAHELAHQRLLAEHRAEADAFDNELLTDLTAVYHGFGVFLANNTGRSTGELGHWPGTKLYRPEYLSEPMLGYAMAHIAWFRDEDRPAWARAPRLGAAGGVQAGAALPPEDGRLDVPAGAADGAGVDAVQRGQRIGGQSRNG